MMQGLRQFGMAIAISVISLGLVIGGLSLALSENMTPSPPSATASQPATPTIVTQTGTPVSLPTVNTLSIATNSAVPPTTCTPPSGWIGIIVSAGDSFEGLASRYQTSTQALARANCLLTGSLVVGSVLFVPPLPAATPRPSTTPVPCGAPFGWVRYTVQPGDTLYHIATSYGITTAQLQQANCLGTSTAIRVGQLLWVPNRPTRTPAVTAVTFIPPFSTATLVPTEAATDSPEPPTATPEPSSTTPPTPITPAQ